MSDRRTTSGALPGVLLGVLTIGTGVYFMALRPPMLPEDVRRTGVAPDALAPAFTGWLSIVFRTWGGSLVGFGIVLVAIAQFLRGHDERWLRGGTAAGVLVAFGSFLASNIQLRSDFLWFVALLFVVAVAYAIASRSS